MNNEHNLPNDPQPNNSDQPDSNWLSNEAGGPASGSQSEVNDIFAIGDSELSTGPSSFVGKVPSAEDSSIPLQDLPPTVPAAPASGWLDSKVDLREPLSESVPPIPSSSTSDILSGPQSSGQPAGSDVIGGLAGTTGPTSSSSIFDAPPMGSSRFANPTEPTEEYVESAGIEALHQQLFGEVNESSQPSSEILEDDQTDPFTTPFSALEGDLDAAPESPSLANSEWDENESTTPDLDETELPAEDRSSSLLGSGVNLTDPDSYDPLQGPSSSIFTDEVSKIKSEMLREEPNFAASSDDGGDIMNFDVQQDENTSSIFGGKSKRPSDPESVFDVPAMTDPLSEAAEESASINWQLPDPTEIEQVSQRMPIDEDLEYEEHSLPEGDLFDTDIHHTPLRLSGPGEEAEPDWDALAGEITAPSARATQSAFELPEVDEEELTSTPMPRKPLSETAGIPFQAMPTQTQEVAPSSTKVEKKSAARPASQPELDESTERPAARTKSTGSKVGSWIGGSALGLLVGVGASAGVYFGGLLPSPEGPSSNQPIAQVPSVPPPGPSGEVPPPVGDARALLAAGQPAQALAALEAAGDNAPASVQADRGQARWLARLHELAQTPAGIVANDEQFVQAEQDLQAVLNQADQLQTDEERQAGVRAALHLGLLKEVTGNSAAATQIYTEALLKFPAAAHVFQTALNRLKLTQPTGPSQSRLLPRQAMELAQAGVVTLLMLQAEPGAEPTQRDEPGFLFWEASNLATSNQYDEAIKKLAAAKKLHEQRRLALAGKGTNPLSDPLEQIFSRSCDDLSGYWQLKKELYGHPKYGTALAKDGVGPVFQQLDQSQQTLAAQKVQAEKDLLASRDLLTQSLADRKKAMTELDKIKTDLATAQEQVTLAESRMRKSADTLNLVFSELKANKLVGAGDDASTILAKLPSVLKEAAASAASADVKKAAEALLLAKKERDAALAQAQAAMQQADKAQEVAKLAMTNLTKERAQADEQIQKIKATLSDEVKKAVSQAEAAHRKQVETLTAATTKVQEELAAKQRQFQDRLEQMQRDFNGRLAAKDAETTVKLQQQAVQLQTALADARAGVSVPLSSAEIMTRDRAAQSYGRGMEFYFNKQLISAEASFALAVSLDPSDARYWYFLGLTRTLLERKDAETAYRRGAEQERRSLPTSQVIDESLERVQGTLRQTLSAYRPR